MYKYLTISILFGIFSVLGLTALGQDNLSDLKVQLKEADSKHDNKLSIKTYIQLGDYYVGKGKISKGQRFYQRGAKINEGDKYPELAILSYQQYARSYIKQEKFNDALTSYENALSFAKKIKSKKHISQLEKEIKQLKKNISRRKKAKDELVELKSMNKDDAIMFINQRNNEDSINASKFFNQIHSLNTKNGLNEAKILYF